MAEAKGTALDLEPPRGMKDFAPNEEALKQDVIAKLRSVFELYGFVPLGTPALERYEVLTSKYAGGEEILKEIYSLEDQGKRRLCMRYDFTVPLARFIASNLRSTKPWPFKRYQIGQIWRDGPVGSARLREFTQCDCDTIGAASGAADAEIISLTVKGLRSLGFEDFVVKVNSRRILDGLLEEAGVEKEKRLAAMLSVDKLEKVGEAKVLEELVGERGVSRAAAEKLMRLVKIGGSGEEPLKKLGAIIACRESVGELRGVLDLLDNEARGRIEVDASLARGFNYYTGMILEAKLLDSSVKVTIAAGGRFDELIARFASSTEKIPAVGVSFGVERILEALKASGKAAERIGAKALVAPVEKQALKQCIDLANALRDSGIPAEVDLAERGLGKNLEYASKKGIPFVAILGPNELKENKIRLRDMKTGEEKLLSKEELFKALK
jgi:histidyl-tRNA synthetase